MRPVGNEKEVVELKFDSLCNLFIGLCKNLLVP